MTNFGKRTGTFGDGISWGEHVKEIVDSGRNIYHGGDGIPSFQDSKNFIKTDTDKDKRKVLDCGCHMGRFVDELERYGFEDYTGVDQCAEALLFAIKNRPDKKFIHKFLWDMDFKEEFDFAVVVAVLQHNVHAEHELIIPKIYDALKYGGVFFMTEGTRFNGGDKTQRTQKDWINTVEKYGFKLIKTFKENPIGIEDHYIFAKEKK